MHKKSTPSDLRIIHSFVNTTEHVISLPLDVFLEHVLQHGKISVCVCVCVRVCLRACAHTPYHAILLITTPLSLITPSIRKASDTVY